MKFLWNDSKYNFDGPPSLSLEFQAWHSMHIVGFLGWAKKVHSADLIFETPGPVYIFLVKFEPRDIPETDVFVIGGALSYFDVDNPNDRGLEIDAKERMALYFAHLLLHCFCRPKYKTPFPLVDCLTLKSWPFNGETREHFVNVIRMALPSLGFQSLEEFMPILAEVTSGAGRKIFLDAEYYQDAIEEPIDIQKIVMVRPEDPKETVAVLR